jgi:hypothetical protein
MFPSIHSGVLTILWALITDLWINRAWYGTRIAEIQHVLNGG